VDLKIIVVKDGYIFGGKPAGPGLISQYQDACTTVHFFEIVIERSAVGLVPRFDGGPLVSVAEGKTVLACTSGKRWGHVQGIGIEPRKLGILSRTYESHCQQQYDKRPFFHFALSALHS
jgi:hypothetical protein